MIKRMGLLLLLAVSLFACNRDNMSAQRNPEGGVDITVNVSESEVNTTLGNALSQSGNGSVRNASIDLQSGQMVITGDVERQNGSGDYVNASFTVQLSVVNDRLTAQVTHASVEGWEANDARLGEINQRIENALQGRALRDNVNVHLTYINITDDQMTFTLNAKR